MSQKTQYSGITASENEKEWLLSWYSLRMTVRAHNLLKGSHMIVLEGDEGGGRGIYLFT